MLRKLALASCLLLLPLAPAHAVATFTSGAAATSVNIKVAGTVAANAATAQVSGAGGPAYSNTGGLPSVNQNFSLVSGALASASEGLQTGLVSTRSSSDGSSFATGTTSLADVSSTLSSKLIADIVPVAALGLTASTLSSTTTAGIDGNGNLFGTGSSAIAGLGLSGTALGLLTVDGTLYSNPGANTVLLSLTGLKVTLNEQLRTTTANSLFLQTNAVHIWLDNYSLAGKLLSGDVILGHSEASVTGPVPEPATWATMLLGFGAIGFTMRRRRPEFAV